MVKSRFLTEDAKIPRVQQVVHVDLETTGLIQRYSQVVPKILQFSAVYENDHHFDYLVYPGSDNFNITAGATETHGYTKESFLEKIGDKKLNFL